MLLQICVHQNCAIPALLLVTLHIEAMHSNWSVVTRVTRVTLSVIPLIPVHNVGYPRAIGAVSVINHYYGRDDILLGAFKGDFGASSSGMTNHSISINRVV